MQSFNSRTLLYPVLAALVAFSGMSVPALAAPSKSATKVEKKSEASPQEMAKELRKIGMQLAQIERKTIASSKDIQAKRHHFSAHMLKLEKKLGYTPGADVKKLISIKKSILSGKLKKDQREAEIKKFTSTRQHLIEGEQAAMKDKSLMQEYKMLNDATIIAMRKADPRTEGLITRFNAIKVKLRSVIIQQSKTYKKK